LAVVSLPPPPPHATSGSATSAHSSRVRSSGCIVSALSLSSVEDDALLFMIASVSVVGMPATESKHCSNRVDRHRARMDGRCRSAASERVFAVSLPP
jgi:hypothetical protein